MSLGPGVPRQVNKRDRRRIDSRPRFRIEATLTTALLASFKKMLKCPEACFTQYRTSQSHRLQHPRECHFWPACPPRATRMNCLQGPPGYPSTHTPFHGNARPLEGASTVTSSTTVNESFALVHPRTVGSSTVSLLVNQSPREDSIHLGILGDAWNTVSTDTLRDAHGNADKAKMIDPLKKAKLQNKPKRPLSAYNLFFREERERILDEIPDELAVPSQALRVRRRKGKKPPHGKIDFESLVKTVGKRWKELDHATAAVYRQKAAEDLERYRREKVEYIKKQNTMEERVE